MQTFIHGNSTADLRLVAALTAMGIPCGVNGGNGMTRDHRGITCVWTLGDVSNCGNWQAKDLQNAWRDRDWHWKNRQHPFSSVKLALAIDREIRKAIREHSGIHKVMRDRVWILQADSGEEQAPPAGFVPTAARTNLTEWALLSLAGFESWAAPNAGQFRCRYFSQVAAGPWAMPIVEMAARHPQSFARTNPQHHLAYAAAALLNVETIQKAVHEIKPHQIIRKGENWAFLHPDCSAETERRTLSQM